MAKKKKEKKEGGGGFVTFIIIFLFVLIWLSVFALLIRFDAGKLGTTLRPYLKDVPVLKLILPPVSDEQIQREENYPFKNLDEAIKYIQDLEKTIAEDETKIKEQEDKIAELTAEVNRLKVYEDNVLAFEDRVSKFDTYVVFNDKAPEYEKYKEFYEGLYPENAERIYENVLKLLAYEDGIQEQAKLLSTMKPAQAADSLENMTADIEWITKVMLSMKTQQAADILNKMDSLFVAKIFQRMSDLNAEHYQELYEVLNTEYPENTTTK